MYALGIKNVGEITAKLIARNYISFSNFLEATSAFKDKNSDSYKQFINILGIKSAVADAISDFFSEGHNIKVIKKILQLIEVEDYEITFSSQSKIAGKTVVFTGALEKMSRNEAKSKAESLGANVSTSISKKTDYVIAGENAGSKLKKAKDLNLTILSENDWLKIVNESS